MVPDLKLGEFGHLQCHNSSSFYNISLNAKFHISGKITTCQETLAFMKDLEDVRGS